MLAELVAKPLLRDNDIARERDIIVEEIRSYRDDPGQYVFNLFDKAFFGDTPLGWEIAGDEESVRGLTNDDIRGFWSSAYRPTNLVVSVAGDIDHATVVDLVRRNFGPATGKDGGTLADSAHNPGNGFTGTFVAAPNTPLERITVEHRDLNQAHICIGLPALPRDHPDQWALELMNTVLGEGSSSRLFQEVREEAALAYDVHSFQTDFSDCGSLQVYAGVDPADLDDALDAILGVLRRLRDEPVPQAELDRARAYAAGRLELRLEESRHVSSWLGVQEALHDRVLTLDDALTELAKVTPQDIHDTRPAIVARRRSMSGGHLDAGLDLGHRKVPQPVLNFQGVIS